jgi:hypothetical protein
MPARLAAPLRALLLLLGLVVCQGRPGPLAPGSRRLPLQAVQLLAGSTASGVLVTSGPEFLAALRNPDTSLVLLQGQLLHCADLPSLGLPAPPVPDPVNPAGPGAWVRCLDTRAHATCSSMIQHVSCWSALRGQEALLLP